MTEPSTEISITEEPLSHINAGMDTAPDEGAMVEPARASAIGNAAKVMSSAFEQRTKRTVETIESVAMFVKLHFDELFDQLLVELRQLLEQHATWGVPPSFVSIAGQSRLEKPFNRLLGWWCNENAEHGLAKQFICLLAERAGLTAMVEDVEHETAEVCAEEIIEDVTEGRMPDLVIRTSRAALLLENKVEAGESGDQYGPYLGYLVKWADGRQYRALLSVRDGTNRLVPDGWSGLLLHKDLATIYERLWEVETAPIWGRIAAKLTAMSFRNEVSIAPELAKAKALIADLDSGKRQRSPALLKTLEVIRQAIPLPVIIKGVSGV